MLQKCWDCGQAVEENDLVCRCCSASQSDIVIPWRLDDEQDGPAPWSPCQVAGIVLAPIITILVATWLVILFGWFDGLLTGLLNFFS